ncbi:50S ribosomal protein L9 [bacterium]|nr:50S ribosomal protein L9 [bacterium]
MKVVLLCDVDKIGKKYEIKQVKDGFARNYLIPKGLAKPATEEVLKWVEAQKEIEAKKIEEELKQVQKLASKLDGQEIVISTKIGKKGEMFEKISRQKIYEKLKELGFKIKKNQIELEKPIETLGEFPVKIQLEHGLEAEIKVIVIEENS